VVHAIGDALELEVCVVRCGSSPTYVVLYTHAVHGGQVDEIELDGHQGDVMSSRHAAPSAALVPLGRVSTSSIYDVNQGEKRSLTINTVYHALFIEGTCMSSA